MASFLKQLRKRGGKAGSVAGQAQTQQGAHGVVALSESARSLQSSTSNTRFAAGATNPVHDRAKTTRRWGRRRTRKEDKNRDVSMKPLPSKNDALLLRSDAAVSEAGGTTQPTTPAKAPILLLLSESPSAGSTATTTSSPSTVGTMTSSSGEVEDAGYVPYVPEEEVEAVRRVLLLSTEGGNGIGGVSGKDEEDGDDDKEEAWNAVTHAVAALDKAGHELFASGEYDAAFLRYERALILKRSSLQKRGETNASEPSHDRAISSTDGSASNEQQQQQRADVVASVATSINNLTYLRQRAGLLSADESLASYFKSLHMKRETLGPDHLSVGKTLNNIGSVFYLKKEYQPALQAYRDARRIMEANLGSEHGDVGTVISNIGDVFFALGRNDEALEQYRVALRIRWASLGPSDVKVARLMQRIAALETGTQPERDGEESESDTDEYLDVDRNDALFKEDIHALQEELQADMKFFDLLEREMALNMLKDKMRIFREMRELSNDSSESNLSLEATMKQTFPSSSPGGVRRPPAACNAAESVSATWLGGRCARPRSISEAATTEGKGERYPKGGTRLTREDREKALCSVQERLARLRAERQCVSESAVDDLRTMAECADLSISDIRMSLLSSPAPVSPVRGLGQAAD